MQWDYFLSHASEDRGRALALLASLEARGARCFIDVRDIPPGSQHYREHLARGIKTSERIVVLLSPHSQASGEVAAELQLAHDHGRRKSAVWLTPDTRYTSGTLELLLSSSQHISWPDGPSDAVATALTAVDTVSSLQQRLADYRSVTDQLKVDLGAVFRRIDTDERHEAMDAVAESARIVLSEFWGHYEIPGPVPNDLGALVRGCRDYFKQESLLVAFSSIERAVENAGMKMPTIDAIALAVQHLMVALSVLRAEQWGSERLKPELRRDVRLLAGLLLEAGWLQGSEISPTSEVAYLLFEKPVGSQKRYLEVILGTDLGTVEAILQESEGRILPAPEGPLKTRFIVTASASTGHAFSRDGGVVGLDDFILGFTGLERHVHHQGGSPNKLAAEVRAALTMGQGNVLIHGGAGSGKSAALDSLFEQGWPAGPAMVFRVDFADAPDSDGAKFLEEKLASYFPRGVRSRSRSLAAYLVRTGRAGLLIDSLELAANAADPKASARMFAHLCAFLSHDSTVVIAGRESALRDSAAVREFFLAAPSVNERLAHVFTAHGVDPATLPAFRLVRARRHAWGVRVATGEDALLKVLSVDAWSLEESVAAGMLAAVVPRKVLLRGFDEWPKLPSDQAVALARGMRPAVSHTVALPVWWGANLAEERLLREFRAALEYCRAAITGRGTAVWDRTQFGEGARRFVRLLSCVLQPADLAGRLALVGPPGAVLAVGYGHEPTLSLTTVTAQEFKEFLAVLPRLPEGSWAEDCPSEALLQPLHERIPKGYYRDPAYSLRPAVGISWWAADAYARWRGGRLPTSLEWEIAGRTWDGRIFPWGDTPRSNLVNCAETTAGRVLIDYNSWRAAMRADEVALANARSSEAGTGNRSASGLLDMVGNVWEWTQTAVEEYKVIAGGSYDNPLRACVLSSRSAASPTTRSNAVGFRIVEEAS